MDLRQAAPVTTLDIGRFAPVRKQGSPVYDNRGSWWPWVNEPFTGAWQRNISWTVDSVLAYHAVYSCITLIAQDVGKLRPKLMQQGENGIWSETSSPAFSPVLLKPNRYQTHIQFKEWWITSKLIRGNAYALKERDRRGVVTALYLLDPSRVKLLVSPDGSIFYELAADNLSGTDENVTVPASEIIHDRMNCLFHPLVGVSPIFASGLAATVGLKIENNSANFFEKGSNPSGILTAPGVIDQAKADELSMRWESKYGGANTGMVAILGNGLKFEAMRMSAVDSQLIEHLKWTAETVCSTFHVPAFKAGIGQAPTYPNAADAMNQIYYSDCLQSHIESWEAVMDEGLGLLETKDGKQMGVELDLDALFRMDGATQTTVLTDGIKGSLLTVNEARRKVDLQPLEGGDTVYMQVQNYSLSALDQRDQMGPPPPSPTLAPPAAPPQIAPAKESQKEMDLAEVYIELDQLMQAWQEA
jgi:HK97 family phage portal protein